MHWRAGLPTLQGILRVYAYIDKALGPWEQRPVFKTNVTQFTPLRRIIPRVNEEIWRITQYFAKPDVELRLDPSFEPTNTPTETHEIVEPYADKNVNIFRDLQQLGVLGL